MADYHSATTDPVRFGVFELDPCAGNLRKHGVRIKLQDQPFAVLLLLLEKPGQLVTREEIQQRLWPADTFVEFDKGIYNAMKRLRETLGDEAETPRYIETLPRRGYRFIAPIESHPAPNRDAVPPAKVHFAELKATWVWATVGAAAFVLLSTIGIRQLVPKARESALSSIEAVPLVAMQGKLVSPAFSPDGNQVAFSIAGGPQDGGIYTTLIGGEKSLRLTDNPGDCCPTWSADSRQIAFVRYSGAEMSFNMVSALGGTVHRLYSESANLRGGGGHLDWSPDGRFLAFAQSDDKGFHSRVSLLSLADLTVRPLTTPLQEEYDCEAAFSPNGLSVVFARGTVGGNRRNLFLLASIGGKPKQLTFDGSSMSPAWTQDGREIIFSSDRGGLLSLWRISAKGGAPSPVIGVGPLAFGPTLPRRGSLLAYQQSLYSDSIWRVSLRDERHSLGPPVPVISARGINHRPNFSPDGRKVVFESSRLGYVEIWDCDSDGSNCTQLTALRGTAGTARWSPDGHYVAFEFQSGRHYEIYVLEVPGGRPRLVPTFSGADNGAPNWSRDGQWIYFYSNHESGPLQLWKVPFNGGLPVKVTKEGGVYATESEDGRFLYYSKLEQPGVWEMPLHGGEETRVLDQPAGYHWHSWALSAKGIYFLNLEYKPNGRIEYFDFASRRIIPIFVLEKPEPHCGLALSPDGKSLFYGQSKSEDSFIMLVKNFR
jgi:Tol biopolymer transport system component/DNA-binding winged helix-turn-helix (wHTH) protein